MESAKILNLLSQLIHPIVMLALFVYFIYAAYLGFQVRRTHNAKGDLKKELIKGQYQLRHHQIASILLAVIVAGAIGGMASTYFSNGQLFVDAHLVVGLVITTSIAITAALTPLLQKGYSWAQYTHIGINISVLFLFSWQMITGLQIVQQIFTGS